MSSKLIAVVGATGTGKSELAIGIAERISKLGLQAEIVNADAMQLYKGMDIGTAKLSIPERRGIAHHLIDVLDISQESTAAEYQKFARAKILELQDSGIIPILVGGSMLYVASCLNNFEFPERDQQLRAELEQELEQHGPLHMHRKLAELDELAASRIIPENGRRIVRALEIVMITGEPFAAALPEKTDSWQPVLEFGLRMEREALLPRLEQRVVRMWEQGLVDEVASLIAVGFRESKTASVAIGYAQALGEIDGELTREEAIASTVSLTQRYARRQVSWFKRDERIQWLEALDSAVLDQAMAAVSKDGILGNRS
ncbi:MAG: tRNA (adenosine(37)-N6)-dimethylallyltransferase MiaA [Actinobacteria bacterium]|jgi:tRNA dimethylallyltransferase|uniref:tRNA dimethylallyltransferase n=1 Tax=freshwater metagenome TaxID=449393 RepID=A0A6J6J4H3_9ZZZZ|nr:tRNA (adenosine(37)-N6)-dimethylallyltransferase MiaA [Actinomycetota bacterium]